MGQPASSAGALTPPSTENAVPTSLSGVRVSTCMRETAAMEGSASPRKPSVKMLSRSSAELILLVACEINAAPISSRSMPQPLSVTRM